MSISEEGEDPDNLFREPNLYPRRLWKFTTKDE